MTIDLFTRTIFDWHRIDCCWINAIFASSLSFTSFISLVSLYFPMFPKGIFNGPARREMIEQFPGGVVIDA